MGWGGVGWGRVGLGRVGLGTNCPTWTRDGLSKLVMSAWCSPHPRALNPNVGSHRESQPEIVIVVQIQIILYKKKKQKKKI